MNDTKKKKPNSYIVDGMVSSQKG